MNKYFVWLPGKEEHGKVVSADSSYAARKCCAAASFNIDLTDLCARRIRDDDEILSGNR